MCIQRFLKEIGGTRKVNNSVNLYREEEGLDGTRTSKNVDQVLVPPVSILSRSVFKLRVAPPGGGFYDMGRGYAEPFVQFRPADDAILTTGVARG